MPLYLRNGVPRPLLPILGATLLLVLPACSGDASGSGPGAAKPRLVVFAPALTSIVFDMGLGAHVVGVDQHSRLPPGEERPVVGSALSVRLEPILAVQPDVLLVNMQTRNFEPILHVDPHIRIEEFRFDVLEDIALAMERIGRIAGKPELGLTAAASFRSKLERIQERTKSLPRPRVLFVLGYEAPFCPGRGTFIDEMIVLAGGTNALAAGFSDWKKLPVESIAQVDPQIIVCQCAPGEEATARAYWGAFQAPGGRIFTVTDPRWTQAAGHLADLTEELSRIIHPAPPFVESGS